MTMSVGLAPSIRDDVTTFGARGKTIFQTIAIVGRNYIFMAVFGARRRYHTESGEEDGYPEAGDFHS
jgi:hypothetical protein